MEFPLSFQRKQKRKQQQRGNSDQEDGLDDPQYIESVWLVIFLNIINIVFIKVLIYK